MLDGNTNLNVNNDLCTCNSGKLIKDCCFAPINTTPPGRKTGYSNPKCYASPLNDCSKIISREHYISQSVLEIFEPKSLEVSGLKWIRQGESKTLTVNNLASKILCERHNHALSDLDTLAKKFFQFALGKVPNQWAMVTRGYEIERWMLKVLCGMQSAGNMLHNGKPVPPTTIHLDFLNTLFYSKPIPHGCGLVYVSEAVDNVLFNRILWAPLIHDSYGLLGCDLKIGYFRLIFLIKGSPTPYPSGIQKELSYHPKCIVIKEGMAHREVHFGWPEGKEIILEIHPQH